MCCGASVPAVSCIDAQSVAWVNEGSCSSIHTAPSDLLVGEEIPALGLSWTPSSNTGNSESWLEPLVLVAACSLWSLVAQRTWSPVPEERLDRQGGFRAPCLGGETKGRFLSQLPVSSQLAAFTERDHTQDPKCFAWAMMLGLAGSFTQADTTCSCFYDLATNFPFPLPRRY